MNTTGVALVGLGTVGSGMAEVQFSNAQRIGHRAGKTLELRQVVVRECDNPRDVKIPAGILSGDLKRITSDPAISVVAHLVGGLEPARTIMLDLLESGKD